MFDRSEEITRLVDALCKAAERLQRGDILTHETIVGIVGFDPYSGSWNQVVRKVRRKIQDERGIATWPVVGVGYRFCTESEQLTVVPKERQLRARRQVRRGLASVEALPVDDLTGHQQRARAARIEQMRRMERDIAAESRLIVALSSKSAPTPRVRPRPA